jgi:hypothetical protein
VRGVCAMHPAHASDDATTTGYNRGVPLVRVEEPERRYDVERHLGRDASSVFPAHAQAEASKVAGAAQAVMGTMNFVTESELEEIKLARGGALRVEDGTREASKPLWAVLQEAKDAKDEQIAAGWKTMKQGQNKPLDEEEVEFLDEMQETQRDTERKRVERERDDVTLFRLSRETMVVRSAEDTTQGVKAAAPSTETQGRPSHPKNAKRARDETHAKPKLAVRAKIVVVRKGETTVKTAKTETEKNKTETEKKSDDDNECGLGGLLGYGSGSE